MYLPSRDQSDATTRPSLLLRRTFSSPCPLAGFSTRLELPSISEVKTIRDPSGDQTGAKLFAAPKVKREFTPRTRSRTHTSFFPLRGSTRLKASRSPFRENTGFPYSPAPPAVSSSLPPRSIHRSRLPESPLRKARTPLRDTENRASPTASVPILSA